MMMETSRRPSISSSIHDYPEDLNPFKDESEDYEDQVILRRPVPRVAKINNNINSNSNNNNNNNNINNNNNSQSKEKDKDSKNKFWTFGRSRKKRSNSFSIKSTWNGIFGKRKEEEKKPTITTVSSTYKRTTYNNYPTETPATRVSKDQQEFDEALGTLTRRRKNTLDYPSTTSSRYGSSLTVNGDPGRIYEGCTPQETTTSIMGELTPKPPVRRFGQVSAKRDIPPLQYAQENKTPIPPRRGGTRSSQRLNVPNDHYINSSNNSLKSTIADENENIPEDYVFKRVNHDTMAGVRKSNLSINSCVSMSSVYASGRKKRRAPPPPSPVQREIQSQVKDSEEINEEISKITKNIENLKVKSTEKLNDPNYNDLNINEEVAVELKKEEETRCEIVKDVEIVEDKKLLRKKSKESLGSDSSFSVKEEIEKIERQIKLLEATKVINNDEKAALRTRTYSLTDEDNYETPSRRLIRGSSSRRSLQENRRNFFKELTLRSNNNINSDNNNNINNNNNDRVKVEIKELPRQQNDIKIVHLTDELDHQDLDTVDNPAVKVIERRISEPIKVKSDFNFEVNPIPKPVRHNSNCSLDKLANIINNNNNDNNEEQ